MFSKQKCLTGLSVCAKVGFDICERTAVTQKNLLFYDLRFLEIACFLEKLFSALIDAFIGSRTRHDLPVPFPSHRSVAPPRPLSPASAFRSQARPKPVLWKMCTSLKILLFQFCPSGCLLQKKAAKKKNF